MKYYDISDEEKDEISLFLKNDFIPNYIKCRVEHNKFGEEEKFYFIDLRDIYQLNYSIDKMKFIFSYLDDYDIKVIARGGKPDFIDDFDVDNCIFGNSYHSCPSSHTLSSNTQKELFQKYKKERSKEIRKQLIEANVNLVFVISSKYAKKFNLDINELNSYGYEGLILAVDRYDPDMTGNFSTLAIKYIEGYILKGIPILQGFKKGQFYVDFVKARIEVEKSRGDILVDNPYLIDEILDFMIKNNNISCKDSDKYKCKVFISIPDLLDKYEDELVLTIDKIILNSIFKDELDNILKKYLLPKEREVIKFLYGFSDDRYTSLRKVAKIYGCSFETIRGIKNEAFNKLRNPEVLLSLKDWLELFDHDDFDICKTLKK